MWLKFINHLDLGGLIFNCSLGMEFTDHITLHYY